MPAVAAAARKSRPLALPAPARSFLKWAGSKKQLRIAFAPLYPAAAEIKAYHEPFLGSGAVFFDVRNRFNPKRCTLSDNNAELMAAFTAVRDDVEKLITLLERHRTRHNEKYFYEVRAIGPAELTKMSPIERGARLIYLNKTCFNGLYRVNSKGLFNVPMGRYVNPAIADGELLRAASAALRWVKLSTGHFSTVVDRAREGDVVYFDPPYVPVSATAYFTAYTEGAFGPADQRELADVYRKLDARGCRVMLSNSDTAFVRELYKGFDVHQVLARRNINSKSDRRGHVSEVVVLNYKPPRA
jgi:DNA adenine methylase